MHLVNERRKRLLPTEDPDLSQFISRGYTSQGVIIHNNCKARGTPVYNAEFWWWMLTFIALGR